MLDERVLRQRGLTIRQCSVEYEVKGEKIWKESEGEKTKEEWEGKERQQS